MLDLFPLLLMIFCGKIQEYCYLLSFTGPNHFGSIKKLKRWFSEGNSMPSIMEIKASQSKVKAHQFLEFKRCPQSYQGICSQTRQPESKKRSKDHKEDMVSSLHYSEDGKPRKAQEEARHSIWQLEGVLSVFGGRIYEEMHWWASRDERKKIQFLIVSQSCKTIHLQMQDYLF